MRPKESSGSHLVGVKENPYPPVIYKLPLLPHFGDSSRKHFLPLHGEEISSIVLRRGPHYHASSPSALSSHQVPWTSGSFPGDTLTHYAAIEKVTMTLEEVSGRGRLKDGHSEKREQTKSSRINRTYQLNLPNTEISWISPPAPLRFSSPD